VPQYLLDLNYEQWRDIRVFLGASYFRGIGKNMVYGLSARGLAIDTGLDSGEEFPVFTKFWLLKPGADVKHMVVYALLESESYPGAYEFTIRPGKKNHHERQVPDIPAAISLIFAANGDGPIAT